MRVIVLGNQPVDIKAKVSIYIKKHLRDIGSEYFQNLRGELHNALND